MTKRVSALAMLDFDGVIADSLGAYETAHERTYLHYGKDVPFTDFRQWYDSAWENNWLNGGFTKEDLPAVIETCVGFVDYERIAPFAGIGAALEELAAAARVVVVSTTPAAVIRRFLERHRMAGAVSGIYSPRESGSAKAGLMLRAIEEAGLPPSRAVMAGDTAADIVPARRIGCRTVAAAYGWSPYERLAALEPDEIAEHPEALGPAVIKLLRVAAAEGALS